jgi:O-antigen/teichoic acid export membrane protein
MRIGQTSLVTFVSKLIASAVGFAGTIYFARELGASTLGVYSLVLAVVSWLSIGGGGIAGATAKRMSEGTDRPEFLTAGGISMLALFATVAVLVYALRGPIDRYLGSSLVGFVVVVLGATLLLEFANSVLAGDDLVHVRGILIPIRMSGRTLLQVGAVSAGLGLVGLLGGYAAGYVVTAVIGLWVASTSLGRPSKRHFSGLRTFAQYAWLGAVRNRVFKWVDVLVLGAFVSTELVGIYSVTWTISTFFLAFSESIRDAIFPKISRLSTEDGTARVAPVVRDAITFAGLFAIPGLVGSLLLGPRILRVYGPEFGRGTAVLSILVGSCLFQSYYQQLSTTLDAIDRPEYRFLTSAAFIATNVAGNLVLVSLFGWVGAAAATAVSATVGVTVGYHYVRRNIEVAIPVTEIAKQWIAALVMGGVVTLGLRVESTARLLSHNLATVFVLVGLGAAVYFLVLLGISGRFRRTVGDNVPVGSDLRLFD